MVVGVVPYDQADDGHDDEADGGDDHSDLADLARELVELAEERARDRYSSWLSDRILMRHTVVISTLQKSGLSSRLLPSG